MFNMRYAPDTIFLDLRPEVKVTVTQKQYATLQPQDVSTPQICKSALDMIILEKTGGQGHSDSKSVCATPK